MGTLLTIKNADFSPFSIGKVVNRKIDITPTIHASISIGSNQHIIEVVGGTTDWNYSVSHSQVITVPSGAVGLYGIMPIIVPSTTEISAGSKRINTILEGKHMLYHDNTWSDADKFKVGDSITEVYKVFASVKNTFDAGRFNVYLIEGAIYSPWPSYATKVAFNWVNTYDGLYPGLSTAGMEVPELYWLMN